MVQQVLRRLERGDSEEQHAIYQISCRALGIFPEQRVGPTTLVGRAHFVWQTVLVAPLAAAGSVCGVSHALVAIHDTRSLEGSG